MQGQSLAESGVCKSPFVGSPMTSNGQRKIPVISASLRRLMPLQERARAVDGASFQIRPILPGKHRDLGVRRQRCDVDGDLKRMRHHVVGQHDHRRLAGLREVARHAVHEVWSRAVSEWLVSIGLDPLVFATHSLRRTKVTLLYRQTGNLRAAQLLFGCTT